MYKTVLIDKFICSLLTMNTCKEGFHGGGEEYSDYKKVL